jgi:hypothetical protein
MGPFNSYVKRNVAASLKIEGKEASPEAVKINDEFLKGKIDSETAIKSILKLHGIKSKAKTKKARCRI